MRESREDDRSWRRGFTLIELTVVMVLLAIAAALVAPHMNDFFRGRMLNSEARRMLALAHQGQQRAVADGEPMLLWVDAKNSTYGLMSQYDMTNKDAKAQVFTADSTLTLDTVGPQPAQTSELQDEAFGTNGLPVIRFMPSGRFDASSVSKIVIRQGNEALELVQTENKLGYEILPYSPN